MKSDVVVRGADDIEFLKSRAESIPWKADTAKAETRRAREQYVNYGRYVARQAHEQGTSLVTAYMHHADAVLDFPSSSAWLDSFWPEGAEDARERMMIAHYATAEQAEKFLYEKTLQGGRLCRFLGLASLDALLARDLPLPEDRGGGTVRFADSSLDTLRAVMRALKEKPPAPADEDAEERLARTKFHIRNLEEEEPRYKPLPKTVRLKDGEVEVTVRARGRGQQALAAKFLDALSRKR